MKDLLLITPPFTQLNTPYPATAYLKGFLNTKNISSFQVDLGLEVILSLFSKSGMEGIFDQAGKNKSNFSENAERIYALRSVYLQSIDGVILFLQGKRQTLARLICTENYLPRASRFDQLDDLDYAFGNMGMQDKAKHLATLYLEDLSDFIIECVDHHFGFSRYAERLGQSANSFDTLFSSLQAEYTYIDTITLKLLDEKLKDLTPKIVCFSVPFPGNLYSAFRCAQFIKIQYPEVKIAMGGGFPNTELRSLSDPRVFGFFDFITLDDGEKPIELLANHVLKGEDEHLINPCFKRTYFLEQSKVVFNNQSIERDYKQKEVGTPDYSDLLLDRYISVIEIANPMHSLWSDGRWNKLTMAHGCYWGKCTFCDVSLDYIKLYEPITATLLVDRMKEMISQTGENGFHFVDEAAPPALMRAVALEIIKRNLSVTWWTNIRFEKSFGRDLCMLLKASGCIAVSGGLEVASDRLLKLIDKGVTVEQVARVTRNFTDAGIMVHAYLMYGYPTQTVQETVDSLEMVRQLFEEGVLQSGFWHQFALTAHSPIGLNPEKYLIEPEYNTISFANNDVSFKDKTGIDHQKFSFGLRKSLFNYMHGIGFEFPLQEWFDFKIPIPTIGRGYIASCLLKEEEKQFNPNAKLFWLGNPPLVSRRIKTKRGKSQEVMDLTFHTNTDVVDISIGKDKGKWLINALEKLSSDGKPTTLGKLKESYEKSFEHFESFWNSTSICALRVCGLLVL